MDYGDEKLWLLCISLTHFFGIVFLEVPVHVFVHTSVRVTHTVSNPGLRFFVKNSENVFLPREWLNQKN
jgi:hypothetical protein